ncbi:hypothetical protein APS58_1650 [Paracidovorax citrulli]|nr:hypothetical protein APS58_1650 [Paracidovorax citrulli]
MRVDSLLDIEAAQNIIILGTVGQGKSMFMRHLAVNELSTSGKIPLFLELRYVSAEEGLNGLLVNAFRSMGLLNVKENQVQEILKTGKFTLFLDGIDEIKRINILKIKNECDALMGGCKETRFVFSSRPGSLSHLIQKNSTLTPFYIANIQKEEIPDFLRKMGREGEHLSFLLKAIDASTADVKGILNTPLMLTLLNYSFGGSAVIPDGLQEFYNSLFHVLVSRHDLDKELFKRERATQLSNSELQYFFECFSFLSKPMGVALTDNDFDKCCTNAAKVTRKEITAEGFKTDIVEGVCLMMPDGLHTTYIHKSIQEFFAASYIARQKNEEISKSIYEGLWRRVNCEWKVELDFLKKIDADNYLRFYKKPIIEDFIELVGSGDDSSNKRVLDLMNEIYRTIQVAGDTVYFYRGGTFNPEFLRVVDKIVGANATDGRFYELLKEEKMVKRNIFTARSKSYKKALQELKVAVVTAKRTLGTIDRKIAETKITADKYILGLI